MFHPSALYNRKHLAWDRANQREIEHRHALLCAAQGVEHMADPDAIRHDVVIPENPSETLRIITSTDRKTGITGYYLPTEQAVRERERYRGKLEAAENAAKEARAAQTAKVAKTSASNKHQKANQMRRLHDDGKHEKAPNPKCPTCNPPQE